MAGQGQQREDLLHHEHPGNRERKLTDLQFLRKEIEQVPANGLQLYHAEQCL